MSQAPATSDRVNGLVARLRPRRAITGKKATPPLIDSMAVLGKEECLKRVRQAVEALSAGP